MAQETTQPTAPALRVQLTDDDAGCVGESMRRRKGGRGPAAVSRLCIHELVWRRRSGQACPLGKWRGHCLAQRRCNRVRCQKTFHGRLRSLYRPSALPCDASTGHSDPVRRERSRLKIIPNAFGERAVLKLMFGAPIPCRRALALRQGHRIRPSADRCRQKKLDQGI